MLGPSALWTGGLYSLGERRLPLLELQPHGAHLEVEVVGARQLLFVHVTHFARRPQLLAPLPRGRVARGGTLEPRRDTPVQGCISY